MTSPKPKPVPPRIPTPTALAKPSRRTVKVPVAADIPPEDLAAAAAHGAVEDGVVFLVSGSERVEVGPAAGDEPLTAYTQRYFAHLSSVDRLRARLEAADLSPRDIDQALASVQSALDKPDFVGDAAALRERWEPVAAEAAAARERIEAERAAAREAALAEREQIVVQAEAIAAKVGKNVHWKNDSAALQALLDSWKQAQKDGARLGKEAEKSLWKRFSHARTAFDKARRQHFGELEKTHAAVAARKQALVEKAEKLSSSTDWDSTARAFRDLMTEWKAAGRGRHSSDEALWAKFSSAQEAFFTARRQAVEAEGAELAANLPAREAVVSEAEALLPIRDLAAAKAALRSLQDRYEAAGQVPRQDLSRLNRRMSAVERAVREADEAAWVSSNPELEARASGMAAQLEQAIADLEQQLAAATKAGDAQAIKSLTEARDARQSWLDQIRASES